MTQEEKELLLKDLSARLSYGVILQVGIFDNGDIKYHNKKLDYHSKLLSLIELDGGYYLNGLLCKYPQFTAKPYLRPMSSMTEEEFIEYHNITYNKVIYRNNWKRFDIGRFRNTAIIPIDDYLDWLNAHHFDYRGLIEKGLALEAPEDMYK